MPRAELGVKRSPVQIRPARPGTSRSEPIKAVAGEAQSRPLVTDWSRDTNNPATSSAA